MSFGLLFWILMLLWALSLLGAIFGRETYPWAAHVSSLLLFVLFVLVGWHDFGAPIRP